MRRATLSVSTVKTLLVYVVSFITTSSPYISMLQFGGGLPEEWGGPDVVNVVCMDRSNLVTLELRREK
jgi:uncharacterized repeat protein (TIGR04076 family)